MRLEAMPTRPRLSAITHNALWRVSPPVVLVIMMAMLVVRVPPSGEFPINDDWLYAQLVHGLLERGQLELGASAGPSFVLQAYWGALFAHLFEFSHTTLRVSTLVLAGAGILGCYVLLRDLLDAGRAFVGAMLLLVNPLYLHLSYSFMTDVPFIVLVLWALVFYARALRGPAPNIGWLALGSAVAGAAYLIRQIGATLPLVVLGCLLLKYGWRAALEPRHFMTVLGPLVPTMLLGAHFESQRGSVKLEPANWTLAFWSEHGFGMVGIALARLAGLFSTLGLFTLPVTIAGLAGGRLPVLLRWHRWLAAGVLLILAAGFAVRTLVFGLSPLFPHLTNILSVNGFTVSSRSYNGTFPQSIVIPDWGLLLVTAAAVLGSGLLVLAIAAALSGETIRQPIFTPLGFGALALGVSLLHYNFYDRYLLVLLPSVLLVTLLRFRWARPGGGLVLAGLVFLATWSIWWQQEYLERRAALWSAGLALVERGIPAHEIDGGLEWNGWHRGQAAIAAAIQKQDPGRTQRSLATDVRRGLYMNKPRWVLAFAPPARGEPGKVLAAIPYGRRHQAVAVQRL